MTRVGIFVPLSDMGQPRTQIVQVFTTRTGEQSNTTQSSPPVFRRGYWRRDAKHIVANRGGWLVASKHSFREITTLSLAMTRCGEFVQVFEIRTAEQWNTYTNFTIMSLRNIRILITCSWILLLGAAALLIYGSLHYNTVVKEEMGVCGNSDIPIDRFSKGYDKGNQLFLSHCASCHHLIKDATGPAMKTAMANRDANWLCKFITKPKFHPKDKRSVETLIAWNNTECIKFPNMTCDDVDSLIAYIKAFN